MSCLRKVVSSLGIVAGLLLIGTAGKAAAAEAPRELALLTQVAPWPVVSQMALFRDRLWFTNSVKGIDHNSAEIYSYDPVTRATRYERHLWSQDAGNPFISGGLLYWPSEDPRIAPGWGDFQVTNGEDWATGQITTARMFHVFAMAERDGQLYAATSAWRAGLQASDDRGKTWREAYDHPTPDRRVSRIVDLVEIGGFLVGQLKAPEGRKLVRFDGRALSDLPGWPQNRALSEVVRHGRFVYGLVQEEEGAVVWRSDGHSSEAVSKVRPGWRPFDLTSDGRELWAVGDSAEGGRLWRSRDGGDWSLAGIITDGEPFDVIAGDHAVFVGGSDRNDRGSLWALVHKPFVRDETLPSPLPDLKPEPRTRVTDWQAQADALDRALADPRTYESFGGPLRALAFDAATSSPPAGFFAERLAVPRPAGRLNPFRDVIIEPLGDIGASILLWAMGITGQGPVPSSLIAADWTKPENGAAKYFDPQFFAIWAAAQADQKDRATIEALLSRLERPNDPLWLKGDAIGALTVLTDQRFGFDLEAWRAWWPSARKSWPDS